MGLGVALPEVMFHIRRVPTSRGKLPDVAFVRSGRMAGRDGHAAAQDMAVEVLSPSDRPVGVADKVTEYLDAGTPLVWMVDPVRREVVVRRPGHGPVPYDIGGEILELPEWPRFRCEVAELFEDLQ